MTSRFAATLGAAFAGLAVAAGAFGAHALRSLFSLAQQYRFSGCVRDDFAAKNAAARAAIEKFGELPEEVLEGTRRSRYAPPIVRRSPLAASAPPGAEDDDEFQVEASDLLLAAAVSDEDEPA